MSDFLDEVKADTRDLAILKDNLFYYWYEKFILKLDRKNIQTQLISDTEKDIIDELVEESYLSKGKQVLCADYGLNLETGEFKKEDVEQRLYMLVCKIKEILDQKPDAKIETYLSSTIHQIAKELGSYPEDVKIFDVNSDDAK